MLERRLRLARQLCAMRSLRYDQFPDEIFDEYAWSMLLTAYRLQAEKDGFTVNDVLGVVDAPTEVAARWLRYLEKENLAVIYGDRGPDQRMRLTMDALARMEAYLDKAAETLD